MRYHLPYLGTPAGETMAAQFCHSEQSVSAPMCTTFKHIIFLKSMQITDLMHKFRYGSFHAFVRKKVLGAVKLVYIFAHAYP